MSQRHINRRQFSHRRDASVVATELLNRNLWAAPEITAQAKLVPHGYELCLSDAEVQTIKNRYDVKALRLKHRPDYVVRRLNQPDLYLEYKVSCIPRYTEKDNQWNIVPIEATSWAECRKLVSEGHKVALLVFCPYHARPLTCELVSEEICHRGPQRHIDTNSGSGTPFINVDLSKFRTLPEFLAGELSLTPNLTTPLLNNFLLVARRSKLLQVEHHVHSEYHGREPTWLPW